MCRGGASTGVLGEGGGGEDGAKARKSKLRRRDESGEVSIAGTRPQDPVAKLHLEVVTAQRSVQLEVAPSRKSDWSLVPCFLSSVQ